MALPHVSNKPFEIVAFPYTVWLNVGGTPCPTLKEIEKAEEELSKGEAGKLGKESGGEEYWTRVGTSGALNYNEAGVTLSQPQTIQSFTGAGATMPRKAWRTDESVECAFELVDLSVKQQALVFDNKEIATEAGATGTAGHPGSEKISLYRGPLLYNYSLIAVGISPEDANYLARYYMPACYQSAPTAAKYSLKAGPAMLALQFISIIEEQGVYPNYEASTPE
jgi:hypothetical protein